MERKSQPTNSAIIKAASKLLADLGLREADAESMCWACRLDGHGPTSPLFKCHIIPYSYGQDSSPGNFFLLCGRCHREQPDTASAEVQILWLKARESYINYAIGEIQRNVQSAKNALGVNFDRAVDMYLAKVSNDRQYWLNLKAGLHQKQASSGATGLRANFMGQIISDLIECAKVRRLELAEIADQIVFD